MNLRLLPQGLIGRATVVMMAAVLIEFAGSFVLYEYEEIRASRSDQAGQLADALATASRVLDQTPPEDRPALAQSLGSQELTVRWRPTAAVTVADGAKGVQDIRAAMQARQPSLGDSGLRLEVQESYRMMTPPQVKAYARLDDGSWVQVAANLRRHAWAVIGELLLSAAILCAGVLAASVLFLRSMGGPLRTLAHAAETLGQGRSVHVPEQGAGDLRRVARAFNSMQQRISGLLAARTQALAAVGHDLRTPLARLRLRAGLVGDAETREAMERDVDEMTAMLNSLLDYLGGGPETEAARLTDVAAICLTLADEVSDAGGTARYAGPDQLMATVRPLALKRAVDNLIQNAVTYAGQSEISLAWDGPVLVLAVEDDGPGIPEAQLERVVEAFHRLDDARARNTGGFGLGLSIVQRLVEAEGGELRLSNRPQGGLRAELRLPHAKTA